MTKQILFFLIINTSIIGCIQYADESTAIKKLLEKESATWRSGDVQGHADCWHIQAYSRILVSRGDGSVVDVPPDLMIHPGPNMMGQGGTSINSNYKMNVTGDNAWVSHNEESISKEGKKQYSYEFRILEKINGQWKLVAQSIHIYTPK